MWITIVDSNNKDKHTKLFNGTTPLAFGSGYVVEVDYGEEPGPALLLIDENKRLLSFPVGTHGRINYYPYGGICFSDSLTAIVGKNDQYKINVHGFLYKIKEKKERKQPIRPRYRYPDRQPREIQISEQVRISEKGKFQPKRTR